MASPGRPSFAGARRTRGRLRRDAPGSPALRSPSSHGNDTTSIRAGDPSTDAPQLSGRGGREAPWATTDPPSAPVGVGDGDVPARRGPLGAHDLQHARRVLARRLAHGQLGRLAGPLPGGAAAAPLRYHAPLRAPCRTSLTAWASARPYAYPYGSTSTRGGEAMTAQMGDLPDPSTPDAASSAASGRPSRAQQRSRLPLVQTRASGPPRVGPAAERPRRRTGDRRGRARRSRGRADDAGSDTRGGAQPDTARAVWAAYTGRRRVCRGRRADRGGG